MNCEFFRLIFFGPPSGRDGEGAGSVMSLISVRPGSHLLSWLLVFLININAIVPIHQEKCLFAQNSSYLFFFNITIPL